MPPARSLFRAGCALAILLGLGLSLLEGAACDDATAGPASPAVAHAAAASGPTDLPSNGPAGGGHCCPCIHNYSSTITALVSPAPILVGHATAYAVPTASPTDRHPPPLVPPPIA